MTSRSAWLLGAAVLVMAVLHQDVWFWDDRRLVFGFLPIGLAYHAGFSIAAACLWAAAVKFAWPRGIERWAEENEKGTDLFPSGKIDLSPFEETP
jgi:hypothetical protein